MTMSKMSAAVAAALIALPAAAFADNEAPPPADVVTVELPSGSETLYPFTADHLPASPGGGADPINLVFEGAADPREVRAALLSVDGDRTALGVPFALFDCTWADTVGDEQAAWAAAEGWQGSDIQMGCGTYAMRFHLRLFREGARTLGAVHMDLQIPNTTEHQVVAWELPRLMVRADLVRSGLLASSPVETSAFGPAPAWRFIPAIIFNGLPVGLRVLLGLPVANQAQDVPIPSSGKAFAFEVLPSFVAASADLQSEFQVPFNQVIPKPFCNAGAEFVLVQGAVQFSLRVQINPSGRYARTQLISAALAVTPVDPATGQPTGPTAPAEVFETHQASLTDHHSQTRWVLGRTIFGDVPQSLLQTLGAGQHDRFVKIEDCGP